MTQFISLPLATGEQQADISLFPEARPAPPADRASGNSPQHGGQALLDDNEETTAMNEPVRRSGTHFRCDDPSPSSSRLVLAKSQPRPIPKERLAELVRDQSRNVWRTLRRLGVPIDLLDDATQEVFIVASRKLEFIDAGFERSFLYGTALRVAANFRRSRQARVHDPLDDSHSLSEPDAEQLVHRKHLRELLDRILDDMPDDLREVFVLFELEKLTRSELADLLHVPAGTVASRLRRAREFFETACEKLRDFPEGGPR